MPTDVPNHAGMRACAVPDCTRPAGRGRRVCRRHRGAALEPAPVVDELTYLATRFWVNVQMHRTTGTDELGVCWEWTGRRHAHRSGEPDYGVMSVYDPARRMTITRMAHVVAWRVQMHRWPAEGMQVHHACRNELCVRADHLLELPGWEHEWVHANWAEIELTDEPMEETWTT